MKHSTPFWFYLTGKERLAIAFLLGFAFAGVVFGRFSQRKKPVPLRETPAAEVKHDLRTVGRDHLIALPGIGPKKADAILAYRAEKGFASVSELVRVKGIGPETLGKLRPFFLDFGDSVEPVPAERLDRYGARINLNDASVEELTALPGIGAGRARAIVEYRETRGGFDSVDDITNVSGIGEKTLRKIKNFVSVDPAEKAEEKR